MHVADHTLRRGDRAGECVLQRMPGFIFGNGRVFCNRLAVAAILRIGQRMARFAIIGVDYMT